MEGHYHEWSRQPIHETEVPPGGTHCQEPHSTGFAALRASSTGSGVDTSLQAPTGTRRLPVRPVSGSVGEGH